MKKLVFVAAALLMACQKHDDSTPITSETASTPAPSATASATPLATIEPSATASAAPVTRDAGDAQLQRQLALSKQAEEMQLQMLKALGSASPAQGALDRSDVPPVDLATVLDHVNRLDAGSRELGTGNVQRGGPGGPGMGAGGLRSIGARDH